MLAKRRAAPSGRPEGRGQRVLQTARFGAPSPLCPQPCPQPRPHLLLRGPFSSALSRQGSFGKDPALPRKRYGGSVGGGAGGRCGYSWLEVEAAMGGGAPGILGKWGSLFQESPPEPVAVRGERGLTSPQACACWGVHPCPQVPTPYGDPSPTLPQGPSQFTTSNLPALCTLPREPENLLPGKVRPPYGGESTCSSPSYAARSLGTWVTEWHLAGPQPPHL